MKGKPVFIGSREYRMRTNVTLSLISGKRFNMETETINKSLTEKTVLVYLFISCCSSSNMSGREKLTCY